MTRLLALLALGAIACAAPRQGAKPSGPSVALTRDPARASTTQTATILKWAPTACRLPELGPMPAAPAVDWVAEGCPPAFMACFSGPDAERLQRYLAAIEQWARDARKRCNNGK